MSRLNGVGQQPGDEQSDAEALSAYIDDRLDPAAKAVFEARLSTNGAARAELADIRRTVEALRSMPSQRPPRSFALDEVMAARLRRQSGPAVVALDVDNAPIDIRTRHPVALYLRAASALVAVLLLAITAFDIAGAFSTKSVPAQANVATAAPPPTRAVAATCNPDGNCVVSGAGAPLTLPPLPTATPAVTAPQAAIQSDGVGLRVVEGLLLLLAVALAAASFVVRPGASRSLRPRAP